LKFWAESQQGFSAIKRCISCASVHQKKKKEKERERTKRASWEKGVKEASQPCPSLPEAFLVFDGSTARLPGESHSQQGSVIGISDALSMPRDSPC